MSLCMVEAVGDGEAEKSVPWFHRSPSELPDGQLLQSPDVTGIRPRSWSEHQDDEEIDILHDRLTGEIAAESMPTAIGAQVTLLARFYERLGDHAVNPARRIEVLHAGE